MKTAFEPIADKNSLILLLGTMPGEKSLQLQQYYGHKRNHFWKIIYAIFGQSVVENYDERVNFLRKNQIALWDVLSHCEREGSADSKIKKEIPNDFHSFFKNHSNIKTVFFASQKAEQFYTKFVGKDSVRNYYLLPSPSPANTWKTFDEKVDEWKKILDFVG